MGADDGGRREEVAHGEHREGDPTAPPSEQHNEGAALAAADTGNPETGESAAAPPDIAGHNAPIVESGGDVDEGDTVIAPAAPAADGAHGGGDDGDHIDLSGEEPARGPGPVVHEGRVWNPEPGREKIRGALAIFLVSILSAIAVGSFVLVATNTFTLDEVEGLLTALFTPLLALTGTALGFYFGGQQQH